MNNNNDLAERPPPHDAWKHTLASVFSRWSTAPDAGLPPPTLKRLHARLEQRLHDDSDDLAALAGNPIERLEHECLLALLAAGSLDATALSAVHTVFAGARSTPDGVLASASLQRAWAARDRQLSIATHELRTPISSILLNLQLLERTARKKGPLDADELTRLLAVPARQLRRLTRMVDLLLDSAQVENERLVLTPQPVDLCELVHDAAGRLAERFREANCTLSLDECEPVHGHWDRLRLEQVVMNLLVNALKYGGGHVAVRTHSGTEALIAVRDHGVGIPAEDRERVFEPFERLRSAAGEDGAGLGLYIVREIVRAHGGRVEVGGEPGEGSTFSVYLPV
jgi:signal transduction histidine kinase